MKSERRIVFLFDLLQDVNILRPLIHLAACEMRIQVQILMSDKFAERDASGSWREELKEVAAGAGVVPQVFASDFDAWRLLEGGSGIIVSSSETNLSAHYVNHNVFRIAPNGFLRVVVQHGFECVGFLQNREHDRAHGRNVGFAADVICAWFDPAMLTAMAAAERGKVYVSGPPAVLQLPPTALPPDAPRMGLVCENLHSVRMRAGSDLRGDFMHTFSTFCRAMDVGGQQVVLRLHPAGKYFTSGSFALPRNVVLQNQPAYKVCFGDFAFGISAPSSVVIDMVLAGIPTAVWTDADGMMDSRNYEGLTTISEVEDWLAFARDARLRPEMVLARQRDFLGQIRMPTDPAEVRRRFARLLAHAAPLTVSTATGSQLGRAGR